VKKDYVLSIISSEEQAQPATSVLLLSTEKSVVIGRGEDCDLVLPCPNRYLSRAHLKIQHLNSDHFTVVNISSSNACLVNATSIMPGESASLTHGQQIILGHYILQLDINETESGSSNSMSLLSGAIADQQTPPAIDLLNLSLLENQAETSSPNYSPTHLKVDLVLDTAPEKSCWSGSQLAALDSREHIDDLSTLLSAPLPTSSLDALLNAGQDSVASNIVLLQSFDETNTSLPPQEHNQTLTSSSAPQQTNKILDTAILPISLGASVDNQSSPSHVDPNLNDSTNPALLAENNASLTIEKNKPAPPVSISPTELQTLKRAFATGCGIPETILPDLTEDFMGELGALFQLLTKGTLSLIHGRAITKHEMRANVTIINTEGNNPLKFAPDSQSALMQLLGYKLPGFMDASDAIQDAFTDLLAHQVGLLGGARNAIYDVIEHFSPDSIVDKCNVSSPFARINPYVKYQKYWKSYINNYENISGNARDEFEKIFETAFIRAYEKETKKTKRDSE